MPVCKSFTFCERRGRRGNFALFYNKLRANPSFQPIAGNAHFSLVRSAGMEKRVVYPRQASACLPIFCCLRAERATRQRHPLLQLKMRGLILPARCWKRSLQHSKCSGDANRSGLSTANNYLLAELILFTDGEGDDTTSPSFQLQTRGMMLPARCWKRSLQQSKCSGGANGSGLPMANNYLFADLFLITSGEGDEVTSPSFTTRYAAIEASRASLEALIASLLPACGPAKEATFPTAIRLLIAVGSLVTCEDSEWATTPSCMSMGACNALLQARIRRSMHVTRIPNIENTHLL